MTYHYSGLLHTTDSQELLFVLSYCFRSPPHVLTFMQERFTPMLSCKSRTCRIYRSLSSLLIVRSILPTDQMVKRPTLIVRKRTFSPTTASLVLQDLQTLRYLPLQYPKLLSLTSESGISVPSFQKTDPSKRKVKISRFLCQLPSETIEDLNRAE